MTQESKDTAKPLAPKWFDRVTGIMLKEIRLTLDEGMLDKDLLLRCLPTLLPLRNPNCGTVCAVWDADAGE
jgi:hypothetical protein